MSNRELKVLAVADPAVKVYVNAAISIGNSEDMSAVAMKAAKIRIDSLLTN
ncbi:hypothetical protein [Clostridium sp. OS1-26]|uniref:hypothetical protein n=1 Tax=Clostridium sp. OS1-26 TaxID=3070681 RepID=UPI0027DFF424|nr:hypothetical protein [Clostridium sp. OS1-26]WML34828.1 hypothetical protein RCG18_26850 [Clostridium sp. OS1-26]